MWLCTDWKIDWNAISAVATAVAAIIALSAWLLDKHQRKLERNASARLLAQIMKTPIGAARIQLAKFRCDNFSPEQADNISRLLKDENSRKKLVEKVSVITIDLPSQFLDKADFFSEAVNNELAKAFFHVNSLKQIVMLTGGLSDSETEINIKQHVNSVMHKIKQAEEATQKAFDALPNLEP
ncbi:hypothetical protein TX23_16075 [Pseudomonas paralactis]|uniref:Uncharacterized protein n=2 Tax=Pseudomonas paralactis TaxID=1615673 RepID=A0A0R3AMS9_9PSED|nr:hypothetical protein TX23_16075 [Pseudomonas paralactis]